jgi:hypothetical protein
LPGQCVHGCKARIGAEVPVIVVSDRALEEKLKKKLKVEDYYYKELQK